MNFARLAAFWGWRVGWWSWAGPEGPMLRKRCGFRSGFAAGYVHHVRAAGRPERVPDVAGGQGEAGRQADHGSRRQRPGVRRAPLTLNAKGEVTKTIRLYKPHGFSPQGGRPAAGDVAAPGGATAGGTSAQAPRGALLAGRPADLGRDRPGAPTSSCPPWSG